jgi:NTP pyrophosphatase (non-canonical NTP hydrolase)
LHPVGAFIICIIDWEVRVNTEEYVKNAIKTESRDFDAIGERMKTVENQRLLHAGIGLATEAGEFLDALKKHVFYGKELDRVNLREEMGDIFWYCAIIADQLDVDFSTVMERNITKLKARYGEKFSEVKANSRDLDTERQILEGQKS